MVSAGLLLSRQGPCGLPAVRAAKSRPTPRRRSSAKRERHGQPKTEKAAPVGLVVVLGFKVPHIASLMRATGHRVAKTPANVFAGTPIFMSACGSGLPSLLHGSGIADLGHARSPGMGAAAGTCGRSGSRDDKSDRGDRSASTSDHGASGSTDVGTCRACQKRGRRSSHPVMCSRGCSFKIFR